MIAAHLSPMSRIFGFVDDRGSVALPHDSADSSPLNAAEKGTRQRARIARMLREAEGGGAVTGSKDLDAVEWWE